jgi:hypothetical protein
MNTEVAAKPAIHEDSQLRKVIEALKPLVAPIGYTKQIRQLRTDRNGTKSVMSIQLVNPDPELAMTSAPGIEVFVREAYPNTRGEVIVHVWSWVGSPAPRHVHEALSRAGRSSRVTSLNKCKVLALVMPEAAL